MRGIAAITSFTVLAAGLIVVGSLRADTQSFSNATAITIPDSGAGTPYPSVINVSGMAGTINNVTLVLRNLTHSYVSDVDVLLVGPAGQKVLVLSDVGGSFSPSNVTVTLSDAATSSLPSSGSFATGTYKPTNYSDASEGGDNFPLPAPAAPYAPKLSAFNTTSPNGTWSLYVLDDGAGDQGSFGGGWTLTITTAGTTISDIPDQSILVNTPTSAIPFTVADVDTPLNSLILSGSSNNTTLVPNANIVFGGSGASRTVTVTPAANHTGTATITVTVSDGTNSASDSFLLTVNAVNTPPTISDIADRGIVQNTSTGAIPFTVGDAETAPGSLTLSGSSSNTTLVPNGNIVFGGSGANRTVTVTPAANQTGTATITVTVSDGIANASDSFVLTVTNANTPPTISDISNQTISQGVPTDALAFTVDDTQTPAANLTVSGSSNNQTLVPNGNIVFGGGGANRTVTVTPAGNQTGTATITVTVSDGQLTASDSFVLTVVVNSPPTIGPIANQTAYVDQPTIIKLELSDVETTVQNLQLSLATNNPTLILPQDYSFNFFFLDGHYYLTIAGAFGLTGSATNTVTVTDAGGRSASASFVLTILPPPPGSARFANTSPITIPDLGTASTYPSVINVSGMSGSVTNLTLTVSRFSHQRTTDVNMLLVGPSGTGVVFLSDAAGANSITNITFSVNDAALFPFDPTFPIWSEVFRPTNYAASDFYPAPAPAGPYAPVAFSSFNGLPVNGAWSLYVYDNVASSHGTIAGWSLMVASGTAAPTISDIPDQSTAVNTATSAIPFTVGDADTQLSNLTLSGSSNNPTVIPNGNIVFGGSGANRTVTLTPAANQTGTATITVTVSDGTNSASDTFVLTVSPPFVGTRSFANATAITIPSIGAATPYPSVINVNGMGGTISNVTVTLANLSHSYADDIDVLLVGPAGQKVTLMSDAGTGQTSNATLTFSDGAAGTLPQTGALLSGTYKPTDYPPADTYPAPAPAGPYGTLLSAFNGTVPNGAWSLYVVDDGTGDAGNIASGWSLTVTTVGGATPTPTPTSTASATATSTPTATATATATSTATATATSTPTATATATATSTATATATFTPTATVTVTATATATATATSTPTATATATATSTATATPVNSPTPTATATPTPTTPPALVAMVSLPTAIIDISVSDVTQPVATSAIDAADNLIGFQGDFTFDETVVTFQGSPVSNAGLTSGDWNVSGTVLPGAGPIRTLHLSAFSNDSTPLSGAGTLFNLNLTRVSSTAGASTALNWAVSPDSFVFINALLDTHAPGSTPPGSITIQGPTNISGTISYCSNPSPDPVANVTLALTGASEDSTLSDSFGNYQFLSLASGGTYTVTPGKTALTPGSPGITTVDLVATQRHFLGLGVPLSGCRLTAADVNGNSTIDTVDVIAIQRFFLGLSTGVANAGKYLFTPASRTYPGLTADQTGQDYDALIIGDVASPFAEHAGDASQRSTDDDPDAGEIPSTITAVTLPNVAIGAFVTDFITPVITTSIDPKSNLVGFQGDLTFDETVINFQSEPVQKAGLTGGNWNVSGRVLDGKGPIRTLRISAYSNEFEPLSGSGTLFEFRMLPVSNGATSTPLVWALPPNQFIFIDADLNTQIPGNIAPGSIIQSAAAQVKSVKPR
jgi:subtilisin-like proprotein convertase family protein